LLPVPFVGDLRRADIVILLQNPGFSPSNYFQEFQDQAFRRALRENLRQPRASRRFPFFPLNPRFCYGGSYEYWRNKFGGILAELMRRRGITLVRALEYLSSRVAILELFPYHSSIGPLPTSLLRRLRSVELARNFVHDTLLPRARSGDAVLIVTRKARQWGLTARKGVVIYNGSEARSAHLSLNSRGGAEMLKRLL
jgi:hypothetical protein